MDKASPWLTLFSHRTQKVHAAQFGLNYVDAGDNGGALLKSAPCTATAQSTITQVLFAKLSESPGNVTATRRDSEFNVGAIAIAAQSLKAKITGHHAENTASADI